jgi:ankyrin repeat protein
MTGCQDKKLIAALVKFLGFPGKTSPGFERWFHRFTTRSHIIWREPTLLPAFWSVNDNRRTTKMIWSPPDKFPFRGESCLITCFFGLDRILLPPVSDIFQTWGTEPAAWAEELLSGDACALFFSHMSSIALLSSVLKQVPEELTKNILWRLVNSVKTHRLEHIYRSSFLDYSALCMSLAELIHVLQDSNRYDMYGEIACSLLYPGFSQSSYFVPNDRLWKLVEKVLARGANLNLPFRVAMLAGQWHDMVRLIKYGYTPGTDTLALVLRKSLYTRHHPTLDLCHTLIDIGADVNANSRDLRFEDWHITPLIAACIPGEPALVNWLLSARANINTTPMRQDCNRIPPSSSPDGQLSGNFEQEKTVWPSRDPELNLIRLHSRSENRVRERIWYSTPLIEACARGHQEIYQALVAAGADVHAVMEPDVGRFGSALVAACAHKNPDISWLLLDDPTIDITKATWRILRRRPKSLRLRGSFRVPVYTNPLVTAASSGFYDICRELIERGADVNAVPLDKTGECHTEGTALIKASAYGHLTICELLVKHGADVNIVVPEAANYPTALFAAKMHGQMAAIKWLLDQGAEINKLLLSRFPYFCGQIRDIIAEEEQTIPLWLFAEESDRDTENLDDFFPNEADRQGRISENLAWRLSRLGITVNQDAIRAERTIESTESLPASDLGSEISDGIPERASQNLVSTSIYLDFNLPLKLRI